MSSFSAGLRDRTQLTREELSTPGFEANLPIAMSAPRSPSSIFDRVCSNSSGEKRVPGNRVRRGGIDGHTSGVTKVKFQLSLVMTRSDAFFGSLGRSKPLGVVGLQERLGGGRPDPWTPLSAQSTNLKQMRRPKEVDQRGDTLPVCRRQLLNSRSSTKRFSSAPRLLL